MLVCCLELRVLAGRSFKKKTFFLFLFEILLLLQGRPAKFDFYTWYLCTLAVNIVTSHVTLSQAFSLDPFDECRIRKALGVG